MEKNCTIFFDEYGKLLDFAAALSSPIRMRIMKELAANAMSVKEIALKLNIPMSTASANVKMLEEADLVRTSYQAGKHGSIKLCAIKYEKVFVEFTKSPESKEWSRYIVDMPIGEFFDMDIRPTCGMVDESKFIGKDDDVCSFYNPDRVRAQLLWFNDGYLEYRFPRNFEYLYLKNIQFSFECCSEAPGYRNEFPSDITFWINDIEICDWRSPGDFGGVRGTYTPSWWPINSTQYGTLKKISVTETGSFLDDIFVSATNLKKLDISARNYISFKIGIKPTAKNIGGINLFGKKFGNYAQNILMVIEYAKKEAERKEGDGEKDSFNFNQTL